MGYRRRPSANYVPARPVKRNLSPKRGGSSVPLTVYSERRLSSAERNRLIKKVLSSRFGRENVKVEGGRGTAYGWVDITIHAKKPHEGECDWRCMECRDKIDEIKSEAWKMLRETGLIKHLYKYYDDMGYENYECTITVKLD